MPPKTRVQKHCITIANEKTAKRRVSYDPELDEAELETAKQIAESHRQTDFIGKQSPDAMVLQALADGCGYKQIRFNSLMSNLKPASEATFYRHQKEILPKIDDSVKKQVSEYGQKIQDNAVLSGDCAWNSVRNGSASTYCIVDSAQRKIVAYSNNEKSRGNFVGNYSGASNMMESVGVTKSLESLQPHIQDKKVSFVHDHDNKTSSILKASNLDITDCHDYIHATRQCRNSATKYFKECAEQRATKMNEERKKQKTKAKKITTTSVFSNYSFLIEKLVMWFKYLAINVDDTDKRVSMWLNTAEHFIGNHENCVHPTDMKKRRGRPRKSINGEKQYWIWDAAVQDSSFLEELKIFLESFLPQIRSIGQNSTQINESINHKISFTRPKQRSFTASSPTRASFAVGCINDYHFPSKMIEELCPNSISAKALQQIKHDEEIVHIRNEQKTTKTELIKKDISRIKFRYRDKNKTGDYQEKKHIYYYE